VRRFFPLFRFAVWTLCTLSLFSLSVYGQDKNQGKARPNGIVEDWTRRHALYPRVGPLRSLTFLQDDPRAVLAWQESARKDWRRWRNPHPVRFSKSSLRTDWSVSLGTGSVAPAMYPAKYGFLTNATPDCTNDFVAYPIDVPGASPTTITGNVINTSVTVTITAGTITTADVGQPISGAGIPAGDTIAAIDTAPATTITLAVAANATGTGETLTVTGQPNIVGFNNLYSGTTGGAGICNRAPNPGVDDGVSATVAWSYYIDGDSQFVNPTDPVNYAATSPALSLDGTKVAFALSDPRVPFGQFGFFIVLAPKAGDGLTTDLQTVTSPAVINSFSSNAVTANSGTATYLLLNFDGPISSPFVNYHDDSAYIGDRNGNLYHILNVFCATSACQTGGTPQPSFDGFWGGYPVFPHFVQGISPAPSWTVLATFLSDARTATFTGSIPPQTRSPVPQSPLEMAAPRVELLTRPSSIWLTATFTSQPEIPPGELPLWLKSKTQGRALASQAPRHWILEECLIFTPQGLTRIIFPARPLRTGFSMNTRQTRAASGTFRSGELGSLGATS
jgi:hypothetical protein